MPVYEVELDGKRYQIEGPHEPTEADVRQALGGAPAESAPAQPTSALGAFAGGAATGIAPTAAAAAAFGPSAELGLPFAPETYGLAPLVTGAAGSMIAGGLAAFGQEKLLQKFAPSLLQKAETAAQEHPVAAGAGRLASGLPSFRFAPFSAFRDPRAFAAQLGTQLGITGAQTGLLEHRLPTGPELLESATFASLYGHPRFSLPLPSSIEKGLIDYAAKKRQLKESGQQQYTRTETQRVSPETGGGDRPAQPTGLEKETPLSLKESADVPQFSGSDQTGWTLHFQGNTETGFKTRREAEAAAHAIIAGDRQMGGVRDKDLAEEMERQAIDLGEQEGVKFTPSDEPAAGDENVPFSQQRFFQARGGGNAILHRPGFNEFARRNLLTRTPSERERLLRAHINEEAIHNQVIDATLAGETESYWNDLTAFEKGVERRIYGHDDTPSNMGHEALRRRRQMAMGMDVPEFVRAALLERWNLKSLDAMARMVQRARTALGTKASARQNALYDRIFTNIDAARAALTQQQQETGPGARRAPEPDEKITAAAFITPQGTMETGANHPEILDRLGITGYESPESRNTPDFGFQTSRGDFITREQAGPFSKATGQNLKDFEPGEPVHSDEVAAAGTTTPISETGPGASRKEELAEFLDRDKRLHELRLKTWQDFYSMMDRAGKADLIKPYQMAHGIRDSMDALRAMMKRKDFPPEATRLAVRLRLLDRSLADMMDDPLFEDAMAIRFQGHSGYPKTGAGVGPGARMAGESDDEYRRRLEAEARATQGRRRRTAAEEAALAREQEQGQAGMFKNVPTSQIPPTPLEQRQVPTTPPVTPLEKGAAHIFAGFTPPLEAGQPEYGPPSVQPTEPTFENFKKWAHRNISESLGNGPLFDVWMDTVNKTIENAPGSKLNDMIEKLDLKHRVYPWKKKYPGAPRDYTRVEIPDFQKIPPEPGKLPASIEAAIRQRVLEDEMFPEDATDEEIEKAQDKAVEKAQKEFRQFTPTEPGELVSDAVKRLADARERIIKGQRLRSKALSAIYQRVIEEGAPTITDLTPTDIKAEDIAFDNPNTDFGAYRTITPAERANADKLRQIFTDEARRLRTDPVSHTKRLAVMLNKNTGQVALVSAYPYGAGAKKGIRIVEPSGATGKVGKPNVPIESAMRRGWEPIIAILKKDPVKDFYKGFKDIAEYNRYLGKEAGELETSSMEEFIGERPEDAVADIPEYTNQDWKQAAYAMEPTEHDLTKLQEERFRPTEEFIGPMPSEEVGEEFRPGTRVTEGEGGSFIGPESDIVRTGKGTRLLASSPLTVREALALHNWLNDPEEWSGSYGLRFKSKWTGEGHGLKQEGAVEQVQSTVPTPVPDIQKVTTKEGMQQALQRLYDLAKNNQLKPRQWNAVVALRKMALEQYRRDRADFADHVREEKAAMKDLTKEERQAAIQRLYELAPKPETSMVTAMDRLYEYNQISESQADYLSHAMGEFARPIPQPETPASVQSAAAAQSEAQAKYAKELTLPIQRRPPTDTTWQGPPLPLQEGPMTQPSADAILLPEEIKFVQDIAAKEFPYQPTELLRNLPISPTTQKRQFVPPEEHPADYERGMVYPPKGRDFPAEAHKRLIESFGKVRKLTPFEARNLALGELGETTGPGASMKEIKERGEKYFKEMGAFVQQFFDPEFRKQRAEEFKYYTGKFREVPIKRAQTEHDVNAGADGVDRLNEMYSNGQSNEVRIASVDPKEVPQKPTWGTRLKGGVFFMKEPMMRRKAAKAILAGTQFHQDRRWRAVWDAWADARKKMAGQWAREINSGQRPSPIREELRPQFPEDFVTPDWPEAEDMDRVIMQAERGINRAKDMMKSNSPRDRLVGRMWEKAAQDLKAEAEYAKKNLGNQTLRNTVDAFRSVMGVHLNNMNENGLPVTGRDYYVPGLYDGEIWNDRVITWGDMRILGRQFRLPKTFRNYYHAISEGPYIGINGDVADLAQHSLAVGGKIMARESWFNGLKGIIDPESGKPIAVEPVLNIMKPPGMRKEAFEEYKKELKKWMDANGNVSEEVRNAIISGPGMAKKPYGWMVPKGHEEYDLIHATINGKPLAVRRGYTKLVKGAMAQSAARDMPFPVPQALAASQMLKHGVMLIFDAFHPGRLSQYAFATAGKNLWGLEKPGFHKGLHAIMYNPEAMDDAVKIGAITQASADWARQPIKVYDGKRIKMMTRQGMLRMLMTRGLNATQTADAIYRNSIQRIPYIGNRWNQLLSPANKWIFDRMTPGFIAEAAVKNLERINTNPKNRKLTLDQQIREVVRDTNVFYGNLGRNGIFKNPTARDIAQIALLAPLWQEGLIGKELRTLSRLSGASYALGRRGLPANLYYGPLVRGIVRGLGAYFVLTQMINLVTRGQWTFQNKEKDHKLDAWMPFGKEGLWLSPMSVFGEVMHDFIRFAESKPKNWDAVTQFGRNKLGPIGRMAFILAESKAPTGEELTTTGSVLGRAAQELAPAPISVGTYARAAAHAVAPSVVGPTRPGQIAQRTLALGGIKTQPGTRTETDIRQLASAFVKKHNLVYEPLAFTPTDQASYAKLRAALRNDDEAGAAKILRDLRKVRSNDQIFHAMQLASERPFTGSKANETLFLYSLNNDQLEQYFKAEMDRGSDFQKFVQWWIRQPLSPR